MAIILNLFFFFLLIIYITKKSNKYQHLSKGVMLGLVFYHLFFNLLYFLIWGYRTDAYVQYYKDGLEMADMTKLATSTEFMYQVCYFLHNYLYYSYNDMQVLFGIFTSFGFVKFYELLKGFDSNVPVKLFGVNILYILLFMPGFHFWLSTVQKDCFMFMGTVCFLAVITDIQKNKFSIKQIALSILTFIFIGLPRPYMLAFISIPTVFIFVIFNSKTKLIYKFALFIAVIFAFQFALPQLFNVRSLQDLNMESIEHTFKVAQNISIRESNQDSDAGLELSGDESMAYKVVAFFYFPLFFNSPNALGYFLSIENLLLLILTFLLIKNIFNKFKTAIRNKVILLGILCFFAIIIGMSFVSFNIGTNARTKIMAYPYFFLSLYMVTQLQKKKVQKIS